MSVMILARTEKPMIVGEDDYPYVDFNGKTTLSVPKELWGNASHVMVELSYGPHINDPMMDADEPEVTITVGGYNVPHFREYEPEEDNVVCCGSFLMFGNSEEETAIQVRICASGCEPVCISEVRVSLGVD